MHAMSVSSVDVTMCAILLVSIDLDIIDQYFLLLLSTLSESAVTLP